MSARRDKAPLAAALISIGLSAAMLWPLLALDSPWPRELADYLELRGLEESGARNLVSAIYLGYRAYDTLGETIVLLVAVSGAIGMIASAGTTLARAYSYPVKSGVGSRRGRREAGREKNAQEPNRAYRSRSGQARPRSIALWFLCHAFRPCIAGRRLPGRRGRRFRYRVFGLRQRGRTRRRPLQRLHAREVGVKRLCRPYTRRLPRAC